MNSQQRPNEETFLDFIKRLAEVSVLIGAFLFLIGWSYLYGYYRVFGLATGDLGVSSYSVLVYSIPVILGTAFWVSALIVMVLLALLGFLRSTRHLLSQPALLVLGLGFAGLESSKYATGIGRDHAHRDAYVATSTLPYVTLEGATDTSAVGCRLDESNYRLLWRSSGQVIVVLPIDSDERMGESNLRVCSFPESRVQAMRIQVALHGR